MKFSARIYRIGINPYVLLPAKILKKLFKDAGKEKDNIPVKLIINFLKTEESVNRNIQRALDFLSGDAIFIGRDKP